MAGSEDVEVRWLEEGDTDAFLALRRESLEREPTAFGASPGDDRALKEDFAREMLRGEGDSLVIGAFTGRLAGIVGLYRPSSRKNRHLTVVWGLYLRPELRGQGVGRRLLLAAIDAARGVPGVHRVEIGVSAENSAVHRLYEHVGFRDWGREPGALRFEDVEHDEIHMSLVL